MYVYVHVHINIQARLLLASGAFAFQGFDHLGGSPPPPTPAAHILAGNSRVDSHWSQAPARLESQMAGAGSAGSRGAYRLDVNWRNGHGPANGFAALRVGKA